MVSTASSTENIDRIVDVPVTMQRQVSTIQTAQNQRQVPEIQEVQKTAEVQQVPYSVRDRGHPCATDCGRADF